MSASLGAVDFVMQNASELVWKLLGADESVKQTFGMRSFLFPVQLLGPCAVELFAWYCVHHGAPLRPIVYPSRSTTAFYNVAKHQERSECCFTEEEWSLCITLAHR